LFLVVQIILLRCSLKVPGFTKTELATKAQHQPVFTTAGHSEVEPMNPRFTLFAISYLIPE
jgi:hypothetical protein